MNEPATGNRRREPKTDAEFLEDDRDGLVGAATLHDGIREFAAGEEARFAAVLRDEVRLGQTLKQPFAFEGAHRDAKLLFGVEEEQVEEVAEHEAAVLVECGRRKLLRRASADPVSL